MFVLTFWLSKKWLNEMAKVNFKIYDITERTANNYNANVTQKIKAIRQ